MTDSLKFNCDSILQYKAESIGISRRTTQSPRDTVQDENRFNSGGHDHGGGAYTADGCTEGYDNARDVPLIATLCAVRKNTAVAPAATEIIRKSATNGGKH